VLLSDSQRTVHARHPQLNFRSEVGIFRTVFPLKSSHLIIFRIVLAFPMSRDLIVIDALQCI